jgi:predicted secreted Zn-dependent protease
MGLLGLFVDKKKVDNVIKNLQEKKSNLVGIINTVVADIIKHEFGDAEYLNVVKNHSNEIEETKNSLYNEYSKEIDLRLRQLECLKLEAAY